MHHEFKPKVMPVTLSRLDIEWNTLQGAAAYNIYRGTTKGFVANDKSLIARTKNTFYANRDLKPNTTYYYRILPKEAKPFEINSAELGLALDKSIIQNKFIWGYFTRTGWAINGRKSVCDVVNDKCMHPCVEMDYGLGAKSSFTNHVEFFIEEWKALGAQKEFSGNHFFKNELGDMNYTWVLHDGNTNTIKPPYTYKNRWGLGLGAMRKSSRSNLSAGRGNNLIGARYYHTNCGPLGYPEGQSPDDWPWFVQPRYWSKPAQSKIYPSNEEIDKAAKLGTTIFVLHQGWMRCGGDNTWPPADYIPQNPKELKRVINRCHAKGMRVGLYMRAVEAYSLYMPFFEEYCRYDYDGLYVDWANPLAIGKLAPSGMQQGCFNPTETRFHAYAYFRFTKMLRKRVGENGFLIAHAGAGPTMLAVAVFDCYLPGEFADQKTHLLDSPDEHIYLGMGTCCGTIPIDYTAPRDKAIAYCAGIGEWLQNEQGLLWQILRSVPMEKAYLYNNLTENLQVVSSSNPDFYTSVYKIDRDLALVITANFGDKNDSTLSLNMDALGLVGKYNVTEIRGGYVKSVAGTKIGTTADWPNPSLPLKSLPRFTTEKMGITDNCILTVKSLDRYEIRGYKLERICAR